MNKNTAQKVFAMIFGLGCAASSHAADWELVRNNVYFEMSIDKSSLVVKDGLVRAWVRTSYAEPKKLPGTETRYQSEMNLRSYNCKDRESVLIQGSLTAGANGVGRTVDSVQSAQTAGAAMDAVVPGSIGEVQLDVVCETANAKVQAPVPAWRSVGKNESLEMFLDEPNFVVKGDIVRAGVRVSYPKPRSAPIPGDKSYDYQSFEGVSDYDCAKREMRAVTRIIFVGPGFTGKIVQSVTASELSLTKMKAPVPQSVDANQLDVVCKYKKYAEENLKASAKISKNG
jgi:hypothetical protein